MNTSKSPLLTTCRRCAVPVLEVRDDFRGILGGTPRLDPVNLDQQQILACIIVGTPLWQIQKRPLGNWVTSQRTRYWPRKPVDGYTAPEHKCGTIWDAFPVDLAPPQPQPIDHTTFPF